MHTGTYKYVFVVCLATLSTGCFHFTGQIAETSTVERTPASTREETVITDRRVEPEVSFAGDDVVVSGEYVEDCKDRTLTTYDRKRETTRELPGAWWATAVVGVAATSFGAYGLARGGSLVGESGDMELGTPDQEASADTGRTLLATGGVSLSVGLLAVGSSIYDRISARDDVEPMSSVEEVTGAIPRECTRRAATDTTFEIGRGEVQHTVETPPDSGRGAFDPLSSPLAGLSYERPFATVSCDLCDEEIPVELPSRLAARVVVRRGEMEDLKAYMGDFGVSGLGHFVRGCTEGEGGACRMAGLAFAGGIGVGRNIEKFRAFHADACDAGDARACYELARAFQQGAGVERDPGEAEAKYEPACEADIEDACERLETVSLEVDCGNGDAEACVEASKLYKGGFGAERNVARRAALLARACNAGDVSACEIAAPLYRHGRGVERDPKRAAKLYETACRSGRGDACRSLVYLSRTRKGAAHDMQRAARVSRKLCRSHEDGYHCGLYGMMLLRGDGVGRDGGAGFQYLRKGCVMGHDESCWVVNSMYDLAEDCNEGSPKACLRLQKAFRGNM
jgi:TPR repeat protein